MTEEDIKTGKNLLEEDFVKANPEWVAELEIMIKTKASRNFHTRLSLT